jgi:release factor glutamine methyltransferase
MAPEHASQPAVESAVTLAAAHRQLMRELAGVGIDTPELDARLLVAAAAGVEPIRVVVDGGRPLDATGRCRLAGFSARRLAREPVSRILGRRDFYGRAFEITPATLDPRPETETLVEVALELAQSLAAGQATRPLSILDVGTGSGAILVTLLAELAAAVGVGTDISAATLEVAAANARRHGVGDRSSWLAGEALAGCRDLSGRFDLIVSNPPYIPSAAIAGLAPEVAHFDPVAALDGGADGLDVYRALIGEAALLAPGAWLLLEVGHGQADAVIAIAKALRGNPTRGALPIVRKDLSGIERCVAFPPHIL